MDFAAYLRDFPRFQEYWLDGLRFVGGDLAIGANSVTEAPLEQVNNCTSIAEERQIAAYWLQGDKRVYSEVSPDTLLSRWNGCEAQAPSICCIAHPSKSITDT